MPKPPLKLVPKKAKPLSIEDANLDLDPNAWDKFEKLVKGAAKMGPKPHKGTTHGKGRGKSDGK